MRYRISTNLFVLLLFFMVQRALVLKSFFGVPGGYRPHKSRNTHLGEPQALISCFLTAVNIFTPNFLICLTMNEVNAFHFLQLLKIEFYNDLRCQGNQRADLKILGDNDKLVIKPIGVAQCAGNLIIVRLTQDAFLIK